EARLELRLGEDADHTLVPHFVAQPLHMRRARFLSVAEAHRPDRVRAEALLEVAVGVVENDVRPLADRCDDLPDFRLDRFGPALCNCGILAVGGSVRWV